MIHKFIAHSRSVLDIAVRYGWKPGARYTNLRDVRTFKNIGFLDIHWKQYSFEMHLDVAREIRPFMTVAKDIESFDELHIVIEQAKILQKYSNYVVIVPKHPSLSMVMEDIIPNNFVLGYSVPTKYGGSPIPPYHFKRPVHLLGGRPDTQRRLATRLNVFSFDCNRFTYDARYGDYFDGEIFRPHPRGGYFTCIEDSIKNINRIWEDNHAANVCLGRNTSQLLLFE